MHVYMYLRHVYSHGQQAKRTCLHVHFATAARALCAGGTRLATTGAKTKYSAALLRYTMLGDIHAESMDGSSYGFSDTDTYSDSYLKELEEDSNVLFAVMYQGKLLSTNLEGLTAQKAKKGNMPDFASYLPEEVSYNFTLCYNAKGDGKVEIIKDGTTLDVYGNGIYGRNSRSFI